VRVTRFLFLASLLGASVLPCHLSAGDPALAIRMEGGGSAGCDVCDIQRITFSDDTLRVETGTQIDTYAIDSILKVEFCWPYMAAVDRERPGPGSIDAVHLEQNHPNPFSPHTRISFSLPREGWVNLKVYSAEGRLIRTLFSGRRGPGRYRLVWDGADEAGRPVPSGVYFCSLVAPGVRESSKMVLTR
jgi:hypothetical protein